MYFSHIDIKGRVVIPKRIRNKINLKNGTTVIFIIEDKHNISMRIVPKNFDIEKALRSII
jgi:AbrB family looped-hinge helix DNA binding protein